MPEGALAMTADEVEEILEGGRRSRRPRRPRRGWPAVVGLAGMALQARDVDALQTLYEFFAEEIYDGLEPRLRKDLELLATMPLVDRELVVTLLGPERAQQTVDEALALGDLDERDDRLELHPLVESFEKRARAETRAEAVEAFPTAWAYYTAQKEPDAAFDLAHELGVPSDVDRLLIETDGRAAEQRPALDTRDVGRPRRPAGRRDTGSPRRPGRDRAPTRSVLHGAGAGGSGGAGRWLASGSDVPRGRQSVEMQHIGQQRRGRADALPASATSENDRAAACQVGRLTAAASLELDMAGGTCSRSFGPPRVDLDPTGLAGPRTRSSLSA